MLSFFILYGSQSIFQMNAQVTGVIGGPMCALFLLAILFPFVNAKVITCHGVSSTKHDIIMVIHALSSGNMTLFIIIFAKLNN